MEEMHREARLGADVVLEFQQSIKNIQEFGAQLEGLDARFGSLEKRIDAMKNSLSSLSAYTSKATGSNLRKQLEQELNELVMANGVLLSSIGSAPLKVRQETVRHLFARVDAELNRAILKQIGNINIKIDPKYNNGIIPIGKDEFDELNKEIARLVKTQTKNLTDAIRRHGVELIKKEDLEGLDMSISKSTVNEIMRSIKEQIKPIITKPNLDQDAKLNFTKSDMSSLLNKIKAHIKNSLDIDLDKLSNEQGNSVEDELHRTARTIDHIVTNYVEEIRRGLAAIEPRKVQVPIDSLTKRLRNYIAKDLGVDVQTLEREFQYLNLGEATGYELRRQFSSLENVVNRKLMNSTSKMMTELKRDVNAVEITPSPQLKHYLITEINKLNNVIIKKIREQIDNQFQHMRAEIETISTNPKNINRSGRIRNMAEGYARIDNSTTIINNYGGGNKGGSETTRRELPKGFGNDPYARRDAYFNSFGLEGAVINTVRHILAGSIVGVPIAQMYRAIETFRISQEEQLKIMQNMALKDEYQTKQKGENGEERTVTDFGKIESDISKLMPKVREMSDFYAIGYDQMSQVAAIASRLTNDVEEARQFIDQAAKIYRIDNESDLVETIAPGLESIMAQFKLSVWELNGVVNAFAVATNKTKSTTDEIMKAMTRSGSALHAAGLSAEEAIALNALAIQTSGQSGENIGNAMKTIAARLTLPSVEDKLKSYGIEVYKTNELGLKERRSMIEILADTARAMKSKYIGDDEIQEILLGEGGGYQYPKLLSFLDRMHKAGIDNETELTYWSIKKEIDEWKNDPERLQEMLARTMAAPTVTLERAGVSVNNAFVSVLEELNPELQNLARAITNLAHGMEDHAELFARLVGVLSNALIGYGALYGLRKVGEWGEYDKHLNQAMMEKRYFGGPTLTGRQVYGAVDFLESYVFGNSRELRNKLTDKNFYRAAMNNEVLRRYFEELSNLNNDRRREIRRYVADHVGRVDDITDFFAILDESRGYRRPDKEDLTDDEIHRRSLYNARSIVNNQALSSVFENFAQDLVDTLSDRQKYDNLNDEDRHVVRRLAEMDDARRRDFENFLDENYRSSDKVISDLGALNRAMDEYEEKNRRAAVEARRSSESYKELAKAIRQVSEEASKASKGHMQTFLDFIDTIPQRTKGAFGALTGIARSLGSFAKQLAIATAVGDVITGNAETLALNPLQEEIRDRRAASIDAANEYAKLQQSSGADRWLRQAWLLKDSIVDAFIAGNAKVGMNDVEKFAEGFEKWLRKEYGTSDWREAVKEENQRRAKEAKKEGREGDYEKATLSDLTNKYLNDTGKYKKIQELEEKNFIEEYKKFAIDQEKQRIRQEKAERARKAWEDKMLSESGYDYYSTEGLKERIREKQEEARYKGQLNLLKAVLDGIKTDSEEYMRLRLRMIELEREAYRKEMQELRKYIAEREEELRKLEEKGKRYKIDPETGEKKETKKYKKIKEKIEENKEKEEELRKEFEIEDKQKAIEAQEIETNFYINRAQRAFSRAQAQKQLTDTLNALRMDTKSPQYIDSQIATTNEMLNTMRAELADLESRNLADPNNELQDAILSLRNQIASAELEIKNLRLQRLAAWRETFDERMDDIDIKYLRQRVALGPGASENSPVMSMIRINELNERRNEINKVIAQLEAEKARAKSKEEIDQIMKDIRELTKQSLQAQLGIYQEMKSQGGTFNLPEGVRVMSQFDYMASKGTHRNITIQSGDMYVNITLPNITDKASRQQVHNIAFELGRGLMQGRVAGLRQQMMGSPWGYQTF